MARRAKSKSRNRSRTIYKTNVLNRDVFRYSIPIKRVTQARTALARPSKKYAIRRVVIGERAKQIKRIAKHSLPGYSAVRSVKDTRNCIKKRKFKKLMMRKIAAQVRSKTGAGGIQKWRNRLRRPANYKRC